VDHAAISITAGTGMTGGGDITASRTLGIDTTVVPRLTVANTFQQNLTVTGQRLELSNATPYIGIDESDQVAGERRYALIANGKVIGIRAYDDTYSVSTPLITGTRGTGQVFTAIALGDSTNNPTVTVNGVNVRDASILSSGTLANARVAASNVTQHQAALSIATSQLTGTLADARLVASNVTQFQTSLSIATSQLTGNMPDARIIATNVTQHQASLSITTSQLTGTLADARVVASNVTQHQASLTIAWSQISGTKNADQLQGQTRTSAATGDTVASRDPSGYLFATYLNQSSGNGENPTISQFLVNNGADGFLRKASLAHVQSQLGVGAGAFSGCVVNKGGTQSVNHNTITTVSFDIESIDVGGWHDTVTNNSRITIPSGVTYARIDGQVTLDFPDGTAYYDAYVALYENGSILDQSFGQSTGGGTNYITLQVDSGPRSVAAGTYYELVVYAFASSGSAAFTVQATNRRTSFRAQKLG
jgi:hypothetical protein